MNLLGMMQKTGYWIRKKSAGILAVCGILLIILGFTSIPAMFLNFSPEAASLVFLGGVALTTSFAVSSKISGQTDTTVEKIAVIFTCTAIMLIATAIVTYMFVQVEWVKQETAIRQPGGRSIPVVGLYPIVRHVYGAHAATLGVTAVILILTAFYMKWQML